MRWLTVLAFTLSVGTQGARSGESSKPLNPPLVPNALVTTDLSQGVTPTDLVNALLGPGFSAQAIQFSGAPTAAGTFTGGTGILGFERGIVLGSGCISSVAGPNVSDSISCDHGLPGDPALGALSGFTTLDATVLEFDFEPDDWNNTTLLFSYVFTSDEYNEYVFTQYNDVFAFWVNGINCALVPGLGPAPDPVTINSVNGDNPFGGRTRGTRSSTETTTWTTAAGRSTPRWTGSPWCSAVRRRSCHGRRTTFASPLPTRATASTTRT
jgi:hypothetical protein